MSRGILSRRGTSGMSGACVREATVQDPRHGEVRGWTMAGTIWRPADAETRDEVSSPTSTRTSPTQRENERKGGGTPQEIISRRSGSVAAETSIKCVAVRAATTHGRARTDLKLYMYPARTVRHSACSALYMASQLLDVPRQ